MPLYSYFHIPPSRLLSLIHALGSWLCSVV